MQHCYCQGQKTETEEFCTSLDQLAFVFLGQSLPIKHLAQDPSPCCRFMVWYILFNTAFKQWTLWVFISLSRILFHAKLVLNTFSCVSSFSLRIINLIIKCYRILRGQKQSFVSPIQTNKPMASPGKVERWRRKRVKLKSICYFALLKKFKYFNILAVNLMFLLL